MHLLAWHKYGCHIQIWATRPLCLIDIQNILPHIYQNTASTAASHIIVKYVPETNMPLKCQIYATCQLLHLQIWDNYVSKNTWYEFTAIIRVTRRTVKHTFQIIGICPWTNILSILYTYVPLHKYCTHHEDHTLLHSKSKNNCKFYLPYYCHTSGNTKYAPQMSYIYNIYCLFLTWLSQIFSNNRKYLNVQNLPTVLFYRRQIK